jgi:hypothetical protein
MFARQSQFQHFTGLPAAGHAKSSARHRLLVA